MSHMQGDVAVDEIRPCQLGKHCDWYTRIGPVEGVCMVPRCVWAEMSHREGRDATDLQGAHVRVSDIGDGK